MDNPPGVYRLDSIMYGDPAVGTIAYETSFGEAAPVFYVYKGRGPKSERVTARLVAPLTKTDSTRPPYSPAWLEGPMPEARFPRMSALGSS